MNDFQPSSYTDSVTADRPWLASLVGVQDTNTITLDLSKFTADTHYVVSANPLLQGRTVMKSGIPLGKITASGLYAPYASAAVDGSEDLAGFLVSEISFNPTSVKASGALLWHGEVFAAELPVALDPATVTSVAPGVNIHYR
ncbi:head decoration protein [Streptomyces sp. rh34]|uniref:head decoration protein n=1 Tax=Streptomyces sp. rh34 TaxID=2034272 RepID=UPI0015CF2E24|nr:head decoration protein [Streptomyces sp. rh34]